MPGQPASACMIELPSPAVRPAVALQLVSPLGVKLVSTCARAAAGQNSANAAANTLPEIHAMRMSSPLPGLYKRWVSYARKQGRQDVEAPLRRLIFPARRVGCA